MLEILFTICLLSNPKDCQTLRAETEFKDTEFMACLITAEQKLARYVTEDRFVKEFGCTRKSKDS